MREPSLPPAAVLTPDVVGLVVHDARSIASLAHVVLAPPDPDGPPLAALTWRKPVRVLTQDPPPGMPIRRHGSVVVTWDPDESSVREPRRPMRPPLAGAEDADLRAAGRPGSPGHPDGPGVSYRRV